MTDEYLADVDITTPTQFNAVLTELLWKAHERDIDIQGAWECRLDGTEPHWEANIVELLPDGGDE